MSNHSVIEHRANYHYVKAEEDYILICQGGKGPAHCKALILSILETWTNTKRDKGESLLVYMTYPLWAESMYWIYGRNNIIDSLQDLEKAGFIKRHPYVTSNGKDSFAYSLVAEVVQEHLKSLPEKSAEATRPNINAFNFKRVQKQTANSALPVQKQTRHPFKKGRNIDSITQLQEDITSKDTENASPDAPPRVSLSETDNHSHPPMDDVDNTITTHSAQEDEHPQSPTIATELATLPPTAENASVMSASQKIEAQREIEILPDKQASSYSPGTSGKPTRSGKTAKETPVKPKPEITITAEALAIWGRWRSLFKKAMPLNDTDALAAELFISLDPSSEDLNSVRLFCYVSNPGWYGKYGKTHGRVTLRNVFDNWAGWVASLECPDMPEEPTTQQKHGAAKNAARVISSFDDPNYTMDGEFYPSEAERQAHARLGA
jgi:hypothetical protein